MKKFFDFLAAVMAMAFIISLCAVESLQPEVLAVLLISGGYLVAYSMIMEENRRMKKWH